MYMTGWTYAELMATPPEIVRQYMTYLAVKHVADNGGELDL